MNTPYRHIRFTAGSCLFRRLCVLLLLLFIQMQLPRAQSKISPEYQIKAVFLYNFTQFIEWPPIALATDDSPFVIGILGNDPFGSYLDETVAGETYKGHHMIVKRYKTLREVEDCNILYIGSNVNVKQAIEELAGKNVLTVGDSNDFTARGGMIRFLNRNNKIRIQINLTAAKTAALNISAKLLRLADVIE